MDAVKDFNFDIWRMQAQNNTRGLIEILKTGTPDLRQRAATALRAMGVGSAIPALQESLLSETDTAVRETIMTAMEALFETTDPNEAAPKGEARRIVDLIARLNSHNAEHAVRAAQGLGDIQQKLAVEALIITFSNKKLDSRVRLAAAEALIKLESAPLEVTPLAALRSEKWMIRRSAAMILGLYQADWAVPPLITALQDPHELVQKSVRTALEQINTLEAQLALKAPPIKPTSFTEVLANATTVAQPTAITIEPTPQPAPQVESVTPSRTASPTTEPAPTPSPPVEALIPSPPTTLPEAIPQPLKTETQPPPENKSAALPLLQQIPPVTEEDTKPTNPVPFVPDDVS